MGLTLPIRYVRAAVALVERQQWDVAKVLADAQVPAALLADARGRVTTDQASRIARAMWRHTDDEMLGLARGPVPRGTFRLITSGMIGAPDLREALARLEKLLRPLPALPPMNVQLGEDVVRLSIELDSAVDDEGILADTMLAILHRFAGWLARRRVPLIAVEVPYSRPTDLTVYAELFGQLPVFDAPRAALVLDAGILDAPVMRSEQELDEFLATSPEGILRRREHGSTLTDQVRRLLGQDLSAFLPADAVATRLAMAVPTLRRRLREEGTSFRRLREDLLRDAAVEALVHTSAPVSEISDRLGFSETSAFTRAFRRWTGQAPGVYRSAVSEPRPPTT